MEENKGLWSFVGKFNIKTIAEYNKKKKFAKCFEKQSFQEIAEKLQETLKTEKQIEWELDECIHQVIKSFKWFSLTNEILGRENILVDKNGTVRYKLNEKLHRKDGPAVEYKNGNKEYYIEGFLHRIDGPAIITAKDQRFNQYMVFGIEVSRFLKYDLGYDFTILKENKDSILIFGNVSFFDSYGNHSFKEICCWIPKHPDYSWEPDTSKEFVILEEDAKQIKILLDNEIKTFKIPGRFDLKKIQHQAED
jgi:hypothetical protein